MLFLSDVANRLESVSITVCAMPCPMVLAAAMNPLSRSTPNATAMASGSHPDLLAPPYSPLVGFLRYGCHLPCWWQRINLLLRNRRTSHRNGLRHCGHKSQRATL